MADDFDDFFDTPRQNPAQKTSSINSRTVDPECTTSEDSRCDKDFVKPVGKPPARPNSAASKRFGEDPEANCSHRVIEAKVPCDVMKKDNEDESYSDDSFIEEDNTERRSGRRSPTPRTVNCDQRIMPKGISVPRCDARPSINETSAQDLSDYSGSFSDDTADSDNDSEVTNVSPLNTPHSPNGRASSSSATKNISKSSNSEPVGLLHADRDSLDLDMLLQTILHMEKQGRSQSRESQTQLAVPSGSSCGSRRNYSFSNEQVEAIDKENHRLMTSIMKHANATKKAKAKKLSTSGVGTQRLSTAAVNRAKEQQKIEAENLKLLRRLQQVRPTKELCRGTLIGCQSAGRGSSARPLSAGHSRASSSGRRPGSGKRARPTSAYTAVQRYPCTSRPATAFPSRPEDDDILTWQPEDF